MSFFFVNQSKNKLVGYPLLNFMSLQLNRSATSKAFIYSESNFSSIYYSPKHCDKFDKLFHKVKRAFLSTNLSASITVEAALVLPLFTFALISIIYLFNLIYIQTTMQIQLENAARLISASTCIASGTDINLNDDEYSTLENIVMDATGAYVLKEIFINDDIKKFADNTLIIGGSDGLSFVGSDVTNTDYPLDIYLSYKVRMPFIPEDIFTFSLKHHCYFKAFTGKELKNNLNLHQIYVYVTNDGDVFHANKMCSHLERFTALKNLTELQKSYPNIRLCSFCNNSTNLISRPTLGGISYVYVTMEYDAYHLLEACPYLQRHLIRLTYEDAKKAYQPCNRCVAYTLQ